MPKSGGKWFGKGAKAQRALKKKEPQLVEPDRKVLALRGTSTSQVGFNAIKDLVRRTNVVGLRL